ncbi:unnamed protein product [Amoebophrya sp. A120]|nr:unnamed protein product [Amoebophrya sp. A120]|eukprot:GSA120T00021692001.1
MISSIILLNQKGDILVLRSYKDDVLRSEIEKFAEVVVSAKELQERPIHQLDNCYFLHVTSGEVTLVAATKNDVNCVLVFKLLYKLTELFKSYFQGTAGSSLMSSAFHSAPASGALTEAVIHKNFVLIYELLDEVLDFGYPQVLEAEVLKKYITQGNSAALVQDEEQLKKITIQATGNCSWRGEGIKYRKNEVYIDVIESVNVLLSNSGTLLRADVSGQIMVKALLSGMPECKFGMNDKLVLGGQAAAGGASGGVKTSQQGQIVMDDCRFHQCVRLSKYDTEKTITFIPPDGTFELMQYRITENIQCPFKLLPLVQERGRNRLEVSLKVKSLFDANCYATNVVLTIPVPKSTTRVMVHSATNGKAKHEQSDLVWRIRRFPGNTENTLSAEVELSSDDLTTGLPLSAAPAGGPGTAQVGASTATKWVRPPISMDFQVPMFTATGLRVRFLRVQEKSNYRPVKWIRYITKAGSYQHRI